MNPYEFVPARRSEVLFPAFTSWIDIIARRAVEQAARTTSAILAERLREEWTADLLDRKGSIARLRFALGCYWAAMIIKADCRIVSRSRSARESGIGHIIAANWRQSMGSSLGEITTSGNGSLMCDINTTPLIDVMLVLLVTLIMSLPIMTHAVKLDLPQTTTSQQLEQPEVIDLDIYSDGAVAWNGSPIANLQQLESHFRTESRKVLQPELHLHPDAHVRYDVVAKVLASAQRSGMRKLSFVNNAEFLR